MPQMTPMFSSKTKEEGDGVHWGQGLKIRKGNCLSVEWRHHREAVLVSWDMLNLR